MLQKPPGPVARKGRVNSAIASGATINSTFLTLYVTTPYLASPFLRSKKCIQLKLTRGFPATENSPLKSNVPLYQELWLLLPSLHMEVMRLTSKCSEVTLDIGRYDKNFFFSL